MARNSFRILDEGDAFPTMDLQLVDGQGLTLPSDLDGSWAVILVYRGHW